MVTTGQRDPVDLTLASHFFRDGHGGKPMTCLTFCIFLGKTHWGGMGPCPCTNHTVPV